MSKQKQRSPRNRHRPRGGRDRRPAVPEQDGVITLPFTKMHGLGNDFVVLDMISHPVSLNTEQIRRLGDRNLGIGFDQMLVIDAPRRPDADFSYRIYNGDGTEVEHCGNGARCFARYVLERGLIGNAPVRVQTANRLLELHDEGNHQYRVDMGEPDFNPASLPFSADPAPEYSLQLPEDVRFFAASMGNPHIVLLTDNCDTAPVHELGSKLCTHSAFPQGVNVGFMQIIDRDNIRLRVHERGAGETLACGTGACAAVACGIRAGLLNHTVHVQLRGGALTINWQGEGYPVLMSGPAESVFEGTIKITTTPHRETVHGNRR